MAYMAVILLSPRYCVRAFMVWNRYVSLSVAIP